MVNIAPEILIGALVVEDAERRRRLPVRDPLVVGVAVEQTDRPGDERVVVLARAVGGVGVRQVGDAEQESAQRDVDLVVLDGQRPFGVAERPALVLQRSAASTSPVATQRTDLLGDGVHPGPDVVALLRDRAQSLVETGGVAHVVEQVGPVTTTERSFEPSAGRCAGAAGRSRRRRLPVGLPPGPPGSARRARCDERTDRQVDRWLMATGAVSWGRSARAASARRWWRTRARRRRW